MHYFRKWQGGLYHNIKAFTLSPLKERRYEEIVAGRFLFNFNYGMLGGQGRCGLRRGKFR